MILKKITQVFIVCLFIGFLGCNYSSDTKTIRNKKLNEFQALFDNMRTNTDKLVFKKYHLNPDSNILGNYSNPVWADSTDVLKKIADFNQLLTGIEDRGYCCCLPRHYTISFYKGKKELGYYCIDTASIKDTVTLFDESYQTSYCIDLKTWNSYLKE